MIAGMNYKKQTDAIQTYLIPTLSEFQKNYAYADEADQAPSFDSQRAIIQ